MGLGRDHVVVNGQSYTLRVILAIASCQQYLRQPDAVCSMSVRIRGVYISQPSVLRDGCSVQRNPKVWQCAIKIDLQWVPRHCRRIRVFNRTVFLSWVSCWHLDLGHAPFHIIVLSQLPSWHELMSDPVRHDHDGHEFAAEDVARTHAVGVCGNRVQESCGIKRSSSEAAGELSLAPD